MTLKKPFTLEICSLLLTAVIAISACLSSYYAYKTAKIVQEQEARAKREEIAQWVSVVNELINTVNNLKEPSEEKSTE